MNKNPDDIKEITHSYSVREIIKVLQEIISYSPIQGWYISTYGMAQDVLKVPEEFLKSIDEIPDGQDRDFNVALKYKEIGKGPRFLFSIENHNLRISDINAANPIVESALLKLSYYQDEIKNNHWATDFELDRLLDITISIFNSIIGYYTELRNHHLYVTDGFLHSHPNYNLLPGLELLVEKFNHLRSKVSRLNGKHDDVDNTSSAVKNTDSAETLKEKSFKTAFDHNLEKHRAELGLTQNELAEVLGVTKRTIQNQINKGAFPNPKNRKKYVKYFTDALKRKINPLTLSDSE